MKICASCGKVINFDISFGTIRCGNCYHTEDIDINDEELDED